MKSDPIFTQYLSFLTTDPRFILNAFSQYYQKFNIPDPTKNEILEIMLKTIKYNSFSKEQQKQAYEILDFYLTNIMEEE